MPRYKLRTLLIVLALGPPVLAAAWRWGDPLTVVAVAAYAVMAVWLWGKPAQLNRA